jgi:Reverse transcriptase (RNA-dependent DNA polymerase)
MAFDRADHNALLLKLHQSGVQGNLWRVVADSYRKCEARVKVNGCVSQPYSVEQGVAQACPLSPLLYNIFMDDLLRKLHDVGGSSLSASLISSYELSRTLMT